MQVLSIRTMNLNKAENAAVQATHLLDGAKTTACQDVWLSPISYARIPPSTFFPSR